MHSTGWAKWEEGKQKETKKGRTDRRKYGSCLQGYNDYGHHVETAKTMVEIIIIIIICINE